MKDIRIDDDGELRCWNCGSKGLLPKRTARSKVAFGVGAIVTKKKLKCMVCGEYNDTGSAKPYKGPASKKYRKATTRQGSAVPASATNQEAPRPVAAPKTQTPAERPVEEAPRDSASPPPPDQAQQTVPISGEYTSKDGRLVVEDNGDLTFHFKGFWAVNKRSASPRTIPRRRVRGAELVPQKGLTDAYFRVFVEGEPEPEGKFKPDRDLSTLMLKTSQIQALRPLAAELSQEELAPPSDQETSRPIEDAKTEASSTSSSSLPARSPERLTEESPAHVGAGGADIAERLAQLVQMKEAGHLTPEEFEDAKRQALGSEQFENTSEVVPAAPVPVAPSGPNGGEAKEVAEQVEFDVILESGGSQKTSEKIKVIKTVRRLTGLGLRESKDLVEGAPKPVLQGVSEESAWTAKEALENVGATVTIE